MGNDALPGSASRASLDALERAYVAHKDRLLTLAAAIVGDRAAAEDVVHDIFVALARDGGALCARESLGAYLAVAARNRAVSILRARKSEEARIQRAAYAPEGLYQAAGEAAARSEEDALILDLVGALPDDLKHAVALRTWGELTFKDVAETEGVTESTAHARYTEAVRRLRQEFMRRTGHE